jgi:hypothetical protein
MPARGAEKPPGQSLGRPGVEVYRSLSGAMACRVIAAAKDDSPEALRAARDLALEVEDELYAELCERTLAREAGSMPGRILAYLTEHGPSGPTAIAQGLATSVQSNALQAGMRLLLTHGQITHDKIGVYALASPGPDAAGTTPPLS